MKIIVTHNSPDLDAIASVWLIRRFLPDWSTASVRFVCAGDAFEGCYPQKLNIGNPIEKIVQDEVIHVDTGLGPLDHHLTEDDKISASSLVWEFVKNFALEQNPEKREHREEAISRIVEVITEIDHFREVFWENPMASHHEFSLYGILDGLKLQKPNDDEFYVEFISICLDALNHEFENRVWAEKEIAEKGIIFETRFGKGMGIETINDSVLKLAQKMGYAIVLRRDPRKGYVRVKALPSLESQNKDIDLTLVSEKLKEMDPDATWFLHVSKKMLLNGTVKNPKMKPTKLSLSDIIEVLKGI